MSQARRLLASLTLATSLLSAYGSLAETVRVATYNVELYRAGPGLLLRDIRSGKDPQVTAVIEVIAATAPDILAVQGFDWDYNSAALEAFAAALRQAGVDYGYLFSRQPNSGVATGLDMDGDGRKGRPADAQGFGRFTGQGGLAVLSRYPILSGQMRDFTSLLWKDFPDASLPLHPDGSVFPSEAAVAIQRLSSSNHWILPVQLASGEVVDLMTFRAGPPVFDGPEDRNGLRNHDEIAIWLRLLDGALGPAPARAFVIAGGATLDPFDSDGRHEAIRSLLEHPSVQDVAPRSSGAAAAPDQGHRGPNAQDTVDWPPPGPGRLRADYVLPSRHWEVRDSGVYWPDPGADEAANAASRHKLVWVDLALKPRP